MSELEIVSESLSDIPIVCLKGDFDTYSAARVHRLLIELMRPNEPAVMIDLANVDYIDSAGLGTLVGVLKQFTDRTGTLALVSPSRTVMRVLQVTGLDKVFPVFQHRNGGLEMFRTRFGVPFPEQSTPLPDETTTDTG